MKDLGAKEQKTIAKHHYRKLKATANFINLLCFQQTNVGGQTARTRADWYIAEGNLRRIFTHPSMIRHAKIALFDGVENYVPSFKAAKISIIDNVMTVQFDTSDRYAIDLVRKLEQSFAATNLFIKVYKESPAFQIKIPNIPIDVKKPRAADCGKTKFAPEYVRVIDEEKRRRAGNVVVKEPFPVLDTVRTLIDAEVARLSSPYVDKIRELNRESIKLEKELAARMAELEPLRQRIEAIKSDRNQVIHERDNVRAKLIRQI